MHVNYSITPLCIVHCLLPVLFFIENREHFSSCFGCLVKKVSHACARVAELVNLFIYLCLFFDHWAGFKVFQFSRRSSGGHPNHSLHLYRVGACELDFMLLHGTCAHMRGVTHPVV